MLEDHNQNPKFSVNHQILIDFIVNFKKNLKESVNRIKQRSLNNLTGIIKAAQDLKQLCQATLKNFSNQIKTKTNKTIKKYLKISQQQHRLQSFNSKLKKEDYKWIKREKKKSKKEFKMKIVKKLMRI